MRNTLSICKLKKINTLWISSKMTFFCITEFGEKYMILLKCKFSNSNSTLKQRIQLKKTKNWGGWESPISDMWREITHPPPLFPLTFQWKDLRETKIVFIKNMHMNAVVPLSLSDSEGSDSQIGYGTTRKRWQDSDVWNGKQYGHYRRPDASPKMEM